MAVLIAPLFLTAPVKADHKRRRNRDQIVIRQEWIVCDLCGMEIRYARFDRHRRECLRERGIFYRNLERGRVVEEFVPRYRYHDHCRQNIRYGDWDVHLRGCGPRRGDWKRRLLNGAVNGLIYGY